MKTGFYLCCVATALLVCLAVEYAAAEENDGVSKRGLFYESGSSESEAEAAAKSSNSYVNYGEYGGSGGYSRPMYSPGFLAPNAGGGFQYGGRSAEAAAQSSSQFSNLVSNGGYFGGGGLFGGPSMMGAGSLIGGGALMGAAGAANAASAAGSSHPMYPGPGPIGPALISPGSTGYSGLSSSAATAAAAESSSTSQLQYNGGGYLAGPPAPVSYYGGGSATSSSAAAASAQSSSGYQIENGGYWPAPAPAYPLPGQPEAAHGPIIPYYPSAPPPSPPSSPHSEPRWVPRNKCEYVRQCNVVYEPVYDAMPSY